MAKTVTAVCPACIQDIVVDPLAEKWPNHQLPPSAAPRFFCTQGGKPMPNTTGETLQTKGVPTINLKDDDFTGDPNVHLTYQAPGMLAVTFPQYDGLEAQFERGKIPDEGAVVVVRCGRGFLAPKVTVMVEYPSIPSFSTPEEADEWMERHAL